MSSLCSTPLESILYFKVSFISDGSYLSPGKLTMVQDASADDRPFIRRSHLIRRPHVRVCMYPPSSRGLFYIKGLRCPFISKAFGTYGPSRRLVFWICLLNSVLSIQNFFLSGEITYWGHMVSFKIAFCNAVCLWILVLSTSSVSLEHLRFSLHTLFSVSLTLCWLIQIYQERSPHTQIKTAHLV